MNHGEHSQSPCIWLARTLALGGSAGAWVATSAPAQSGNVPLLRTTPAQTEGPFYPQRDPKDADYNLLRHGSKDCAKGKPAWVEGGVVLDRAGKPLRGGALESSRPIMTRTRDLSSRDDQAGATQSSTLPSGRVRMPHLPLPAARRVWTGTQLLCGP